MRARLRGHVDRPLSATGLRCARLTCLTGTTETVALDVAHAWHLDGPACASLFCVRDGSAMAGTTLLLVEEPFKPAALWLWLKTARSVRALEPSRIADHLIGSDFVYDDLRTWTPRPLTWATRCEDADGGVALYGAGPWKHGETVATRSLVDEATGLVVDVSWTRPGCDRPFRRLVSSQVTMVGRDIAMPREIWVSQPDDGYESRLSLQGQATDVPLAAALFTPDGMTGAKDALGDLAARALQGMHR